MHIIVLRTLPKDSCFCLRSQCSVGKFPGSADTCAEVCWSNHFQSTIVKLTNEMLEHNIGSSLARGHGQERNLYV